MLEIILAQGILIQSINMTSWFFICCSRGMGNSISAIPK